MWWQIWLPSSQTITIFTDLCEWILVCLHNITLWVENFPVYVPYHQPGSVWLYSRLWYTLLFIYWWPAEWGTSHKSGALVLPENRGQECGLSAAIATMYCVVWLLVDLGYTIAIAKPVLYPTTSVEYPRLTVHSLKQEFIVRCRKIEA